MVLILVSNASLFIIWEFFVFAKAEGEPRDLSKKGRPNVRPSQDQARDIGWAGSLFLRIIKGAVSTLPQQYEVASYWTERAPPSQD